MASRNERRGRGTYKARFAMTHRTRPAPLAFTLVELLVVLGILGTLIGLLLPAVQKVRTSAAMARSSRNLQQIALGTHQYHDSYRVLPDNVTVLENTKATRPYCSTFVKILPFVEQDNLYRATMNQGLTALLVPLPLYISPADPSNIPTNGLGSYAGNDQLFGSANKSLPISVPDGTSNTILFTERWMACGSPTYLNAWPITVDGTALNGESKTLAATLTAGMPLQFAPSLSSCVPGGASTVSSTSILTALADGSVRAVSSAAARGFATSPTGTITSWEAALTPDGYEVLGPDW
jgi:type II secretory pathway pseudopilin PulG